MHNSEMCFIIHVLLIPACFGRCWDLHQGTFNRILLVYCITLNFPLMHRYGTYSVN